MSEIVIRPRKLDEVARCVDVLADVQERDGYPGDWPADPIRWLSPPNAFQTWVAVLGEGEILGHVMVRAVKDVVDAAMVSRFFVAPSARGRGAGKLLLETCHEWAVSQAKRLRLEVADNSRAAMRLYERMGWKHCGSYVADWGTPGFEAVTVHRYELV